MFHYITENQIFNKNKIQEFEEKYRRNFAENFEKVKFLEKNQLDKGNISFAVLIVSVFEAFLASGFPKEKAIEMTDNCVNLPVRETIRLGTKMMLDHSEKPFEAIVEASKIREQEYFGESFDFERVIDSPFGYVLEVKKCLFHLVFNALGKSELLFIACKMDLGWINGIDEEKHFVKFSRPTTYASSSTCQMWWIRQEKL